MSDEPITPVAFERIIATLNRRKVKCMLISGIAVRFQGVPLPRTADLDITPSGDAENRKRLVRALQDLEAKLRAPGLSEGIEIPLDERTFTGMVTMTFLTRFGPFDISFIPDGTTGYDDLREDSLTLERLDVKIPVASVKDIIRSKKASGREKDAGHLVILMEFLRESGGDA